MSDWIKYPGEYEKRWYDIKLFNGTIYKDCYPNAGTFHPMGTNLRIKEADVAEYKEVDDPFWRSK